MGLGTWHNSSQVKLTNEESCQITNYNTKYKLESQNLLGNNGASVTWEQSCQCHLGTIVPVSLGNNCAGLTCEQLCQSHLETIVPVSLGNSCASITWEQLYQSHLGIIIPVSLGNNLASLTRENCSQVRLTQLLPSETGTIVPKWHWRDCAQVDFDFLIYILLFSLFFGTIFHCLSFTWHMIHGTWSLNLHNLDWTIKPERFANFPRYCPNLLV